MSGKSTYTIDEEYFKDIDSPDKAFWFGLLCADGDISVHHGLRLKLCQKNKLLVQKFVDDSKFSGNAVERKANKNSYANSNMFEVFIYNRNFIGNLLLAGKTHYKHDLKGIPDSVPTMYKRDFIRGYFEGDGCISFSTRKGVPQYWALSLSGNYDFLLSIKTHINSELLYNENTGGLTKDHSIYRLIYSSNNRVEDIMNYLYNGGFGLKLEKYRLLNVN